MEGDIGDPTLQIKRLQRCINDLVSILSLPAVWGGDLEQILSILLDALLDMLGLDFACARLRRSIQEPPIEVLRTAQASVLANNRQSIREALNGWFVDEPNTWPLSGRSFIGSVSWMCHGYTKARKSGRHETLSMSAFASYMRCA